MTPRSNGRIFHSKHFFNCNTTNVINAITCKSCNIQYVGLTTHRLRNRFRAHLSDIRTEKSTNVARHFNNHHDGNTGLVQVQIVERVKL